MANNKSGYRFYKRDLNQFSYFKDE